MRVRTEGPATDGPKWYERSFRRNLVDMHIPDWNPEFLSEFDPAAYVEALKTARVQTAMIYANSQTGCCHWPTRSGRMHRGLKGKDLVGDLSERCHRAGMDVVLYYSVIFNNEAYADHPDWRILDQDGNPSRGADGAPATSRYGFCCPNSDGYRAFVAAQIEELCVGYDFEGLFFDMTFWPGYCHCDACRRRFRDEEGAALPDTIDGSDARWIAFARRREAWLLEFASFCTATVHRHAPGATVEHNVSALTDGTLGVPLAIADCNEYVGGDFFGGFLQQSFICKLYYNLTPHVPFEYMTSRCDPFVWDHTTTKSRHALGVHAGLALAHDGAFLFIDAIDPVGTLDPRVYRTLGDVFADTARFEPFLGGRLAQDVGIYFSPHANVDAKRNGTRTAFGLASAADAGGTRHMKAILGAVKALKENHVPFGVCTRRNLDGLPHRIVVLPEVTVLDREEVDAFRRFVAEGGRLYLSGVTDRALLSDVFGIAIRGGTKEAETYIAPCGPGCEAFPDIAPRCPLSIHDRQAIGSIVGRHEVLARIALPFTDPSDRSVFASIHSNPPGVWTDDPAIVEFGYGRGRVTWVAASIESVDQDAHRDVFIRLIRRLADGPFSFEASLSQGVEVLLHRQAAGKRDRVVLAGTRERPLPGASIPGSVRIALEGRKVLRVLRLPGQEAVAFRVEGGFLEMDVLEPEGLGMLAVDYE